jgi:hypothetical protein
MSIDFNQLMKQADAAGFTIVPDGRYDVIVTKSEVKPTSTSKEMIKVVAEIDGGPHNKRKLFTQHVLSPDNDNALRFFFEHMAGYGLAREWWLQPGASLAAAAQAILGRPAVFEIGHKEYPAGSGQQRNEVLKVLPRGAGGGAPLIGAGPAAAPAIPGPGAAAPAAASPGAVPPVVVPQPAAPVVAPVVPQVPGPPAEPTYGDDEEPF